MMAAASLIVTPIYTRHLTLSEFGLLALMLVFYGLMKQVYDLGFTNSVGRFFFDYADEKDDSELPLMRSTSTAFMAAWGGAWTLALIVFASPIADLLMGDSAHADLVRIVGATLYAEALAIVPLTVIRMQERSGLYVRISVARFAGTLVLSILFVAGLGWGVRGALLAIAVPTAGILLLLIAEYRLSLGRGPSLELLKRMLAFGLPFFPVLLSAWVIDGSDRYIIELFRSREEVGTYALAYRIAAVMQIVITAFSMGWAPLRYKIYEQPDARETYRRLASYYVVVISFIGVGLGVFSRDIVAVIAPSSYAAAGVVVPLIALAYAIYGVNLLMITGMGVTKRTGPLAPIALAGAAVNIALNLLLVPRLGIQAAALSTVAAMALMTAGAWWYSQRAYAINYDWLRIAKVTLLAMAFVCVGFALVPAAGLVSVASGLALWLGFGAALVLTGLVHRDDVVAGRSLLLGLYGRLAREKAP